MITSCRRLRTPAFRRSQRRCRDQRAHASIESVIRYLSSAREWRLEEGTGRVYRRNDETEAPSFQTIVGLEIHAQLDISTKLFSPARTVSSLQQANLPPNHCGTTLYPFDVGVPGFLPVVSQEAVQSAVLAAAVLKCSTINTRSRFERKHYAYADLPLHYQVTQQRWPLAREGLIEATTAVAAKQPSKKKSKSKSADTGTPVKCRIHRIQLEQDTGKTTTAQSRLLGFDTKHPWRVSCVDLNRAGQALIEIVTEPDLRSPQEAASVLEHVRMLLKHVGVCNGRMEDGSLRCDVNVNLQRINCGEGETRGDAGGQPLRSPRVEVKNLNSIRQVREAIEHEVLRQADAWTNRDNIDLVEETRTWNPASRKTILIRLKDQAQDYRFLPEPDLPPVLLNEKMLGGLSLAEFIDCRMPELPEESLKRLQEVYGLSNYQAGVITGDPPAIAFFDLAVAVARKHVRDDLSNLSSKEVAAMTANFLINDLFGIVKENTAEELDATLQMSEVSADQLGKVIALILNFTISTTMAKKLLRALYNNEKGGDPESVAAKLGFELISDPHRLEQICRAVVESHPEELAKYREGGKYEAKMTKFFLGKSMAASRGNAEPEKLKDVLKTVLQQAGSRYSGQ